MFEMCSLPQQKKKLLEALNPPTSKPKENVQLEEEISETSIGEKSKSRTLPFLLTFEIFNHNVHNCLVDSRASANVMPLLVCKRINGQPKPSNGKIIQLERTTMKVVGEMEDMLIHLSADERVCQFVDTMVADVPEAYGLILS